MSNRKWSSDQKLQTLFEGFRSWTKGGVLKEAGEQIFKSGASDADDRTVDHGEEDREGGGFEPHPMMADVLKGLGPEEVAQAMWLEAARVDDLMQHAKPYGSYESKGIEFPEGKMINPRHVWQRGINGKKRKHILTYAKNLGMYRGGDDFDQAGIKHLQHLDGDEGFIKKIIEPTFGGMASVRNAAGGLQETPLEKLKPFVIKDPISGDTFSFTPALTENGFVGVMKIG